MILDARDDFKRSDLSKNWSEFMVSNAFTSAAIAAMMELDRTLPIPENQEQAAANHWRRDGANRFLYALMNLAEPGTSPAPKATTSNLDHRK